MELTLTNLTKDDFVSYLHIHGEYPTRGSLFDAPYDKGTESVVSRYNNGCPMTMPRVGLGRGELDSPFPVREVPVSVSLSGLVCQCSCVPPSPPKSIWRGRSSRASSLHGFPIHN